MSREMELLSPFNQAALLKSVLQFRVSLKIVFNGIKQLI